MDTRIVGLALYVIVLLGIGTWATRATKSIDDWAVAGRRLGVWVMAFTTIATTASGFAFVGVPGLSYAFGWPPMIWILASIVGIPIAFVLLGRPMRTLSQEAGSLTMPDLLGHIYRSRSVQVVAGLIVTLGFFAFLVVQWSASARTLEGFFDLTYTQGLWITVVVVAVYVSFGGMLAIAYTDVLQMVMMFGAGVLVLAVGLGELGGLTALNETLADESPSLVAATSPAGTPYDVGGAISTFLVFGICLGGYVLMSIRMFYTRSVSTLRWGALICVVAYIVGSFFIWTAGAMYRALELRGEVPGLEVPDLAMSAFVSELLPEVAGAFVLAAILAAIMSTIDSALIMTSTGVARDLYEKALRRTLSDSARLLHNRLAVIAVTVVTVALSSSPPAFIGDLAVAVIGVLVASFFVVLVLGLRWRRATMQGALAAMVGGCAVSTGFELGDVQIGVLSGASLGIFVSLAAMVIVSLATYRNPLPVHAHLEPRRQSVP
jgi:sodium/proline symporter